MTPFMLDIHAIEERARIAMEQGAVTAGYRGQRERVVQVLNEVLATELVCAFRYKYHYFMAKGLDAEAVRAEFLQHATEEQAHADAVARRIVQLNGRPELDPQKFASLSHSHFAEGEDLVAMIKEDLVAERVAIDVYREIVRWVGDWDPTTRRLMATILEKEEEHAEDLANLLVRQTKAAGAKA
jgi:bacterioferritin